MTRPMWLAGTLLGVAAGLVVGLGGAGFAQQANAPAKQDPKADAKAAEKEKVKKIQALVMKIEKATPDAKPPLIEELGKFVHPMVVGQLKAWVMGFQIQGVPMLTQQVRLASAKALGKQRDPKDPRIAAAAAAALMDATEERWNKKEREGDGVVRLCIEGLGELKDKSALKFLKKLITDPHNYWAGDAIASLEKMWDVSVIEPIIDEWLHAENEGKKQNANDVAKERRQLIGDAAAKTLTVLTGQSFDTALKWQKWWSDNKRTFKLAKPAGDEPPSDEGGGEKKEGGEEKKG